MQSLKYLRNPKQKENYYNLNNIFVVVTVKKCKNSNFKKCDFYQNMKNTISSKSSRFNDLDSKYIRSGVNEKNNYYLFEDNNDMKIWLK